MCCHMPDLYVSCPSVIICINMINQQLFIYKGGMTQGFLHSCAQRSTAGKVSGIPMLPNAHDTVYSGLIVSSRDGYGFKSRKIFNSARRDSEPKV